MANSLPFNAVAVDGEYDRVYKAEDWAWYFATFIANGIFPKPSDGLQVVAYSGMEIRVNEVVSIFKNMALCGLPVKKVWEKVREFLAKYTDELPDTDELDGDSTTGNVEERRTQER